MIGVTVCSSSCVITRNRVPSAETQYGCQIPPGPPGVGIRSWNYSRMTGAARARARRELDDLRSLPGRRTALCHADIGGNIVYDRTADTLGFIDFGGAVISDPVLDVAGLSVLGDELIRAGAARYPLLVEPLAEAPDVRATFALQDALYAARQEDWAHVEAVLCSYEQ